MVTMDIGELKDEAGKLQEFLEKKLSIKIKVDGKVMNLSSEEGLSRSKVKDYVERFFYRNDLSNMYKVRIEKDAIKVVKKKS